MNDDDFSTAWANDEEGGDAGIFGDGAFSSGAFWAEEKANPIDQLLFTQQQLLADGEEEPESMLGAFLQERMILHEVTGHNVDLLHYLLSKLDKLVTLALLSNSSDSAMQQQSQVAFEILTANTNELTEPLLLKHLPQIFSLLSTLDTPNPRLAGNFHAILNMLCARDARAVLTHASRSLCRVVATSAKPSQPQQQRSVEELIQVFENGPVSMPPPPREEEAVEQEPEEESIILSFIRHLDVAAIASAFICLIQASFQLEEEEGGVAAAGDFSAWQGAHGTAQLVLRKMATMTCPHNASEVLLELYRLTARKAQAARVRQVTTALSALVDEDSAPGTGNAATAAAATATATAQQNVQWTAPLVRDMCQTLLDSTIQEEEQSIALLTVLHEVVQVYAQPFSKRGDASVVVGAEEMQELVNALPALGERFRGSSDGKALGMQRLLYASIVCEFIQCGHHELIRELAPCCLQLLVDWFFAYAQNSLLHGTVMRALRAILAGHKPAIQAEPLASRTRFGNDNTAVAAALAATAQREAMQEMERRETLRALEPLQEILLSSSHQCGLIQRILAHAELFAPVVVEEQGEDAAQGVVGLVLEENYFSADHLSKPKQQKRLEEEAAVTAVVARKPYVRRPAYLGHLRVLATDLSNLIDSQMQEEVNGGEGGSAAFDALRQLPEDLVQKWHDFVAGRLAEANERVRRPLGSTSAFHAPRPATRRFDQPNRLAQFGQYDMADAEEEEEDDDDDEDEDDDDDAEEVMRRYHARSQEDTSNLLAAFGCTEDWDDARGEEEEERPATASSSAIPITLRNTSPTSGQKRPQQELLGVSPSWVTSGFDHDESSPS